MIKQNMKKSRVHFQQVQNHGPSKNQHKKHNVRIFEFSQTQKLYRLVLITETGHDKIHAGVTGGTEDKMILGSADGHHVDNRKGNQLDFKEIFRSLSDSID